MKQQRGFFDETTVDMSQPAADRPFDVHDAQEFIRHRAFDPPTVEPNRSVPAAAAPRVSAQAVRVLNLLRGGRTSVSDLRTIACQYNARIYELRKAGYVIENVDVDHATGESWYELRAEPTAIADGIYVVHAGTGVGHRASSTPDQQEQKS